MLQSDRTSWIQWCSTYLERYSQRQRQVSHSWSIKIQIIQNLSIEFLNIWTFPNCFKALLRLSFKREAKVLRHFFELGCAKCDAFASWCHWNLIEFVDFVCSFVRRWIWPKISSETLWSKSPCCDLSDAKSYVFSVSWIISAQDIERGHHQKELSCAF